MHIFAVTRLKCLWCFSFSGVFLWGILSAGVLAQSQDEGSSALLSQRAQFLELEKQLGRASRQTVERLEDEVAALSSYPLHPYLVRQQLDQRMDLAHRHAIEEFLLTYNNQPFTYGLRGRWLRYLAKHDQKKAFLANYRDGMGATITCQYLEYQLQDAKQPQYWLEKVTPIWLSGYSQPNECDPVFKQWQQAGLMTTEHVLQRIEKAALAGNANLVTYLKSKLPKAKQYLPALWLGITRAPQWALKQSKFPLAQPTVEAKMLAYGVEKLAWKDPESAIRAYHLWQPKNLFNQTQRLSIHRAIALSLAIDDKPQADEWLRRADVAGAKSDIKRWHMAYLLKHRQWKEVLALIADAPDTIQQQDSYRYWRARSLAELGMEDEAQTLYQALSQERHFYGFMASAKLAQPPTIKHQSVPKDEQTLSMISQRPAAQRAKEFLALNRLVDARREWRYLVKSLDPAQIKDAALLASEWGWFDQAIISFTQSGFMDDIEKRFPLAYAEQFAALGSVYDIKPAFAMAIARRESSFMVDAVSPSGARGLMQLMPGTARYIAKKKVTTSELYDADQNVTYGVQYLRYLMDKMGDDPVLVSASYNAGWQRVMQWLPEDRTVDTDIWIETIPYKETRSYVKAVMAYRYIYEYQLGESPSLFQQLAKSAIPSAPGLLPASGGKTGTYAPK
ncbi:transglycosylase SLT domain-containing protein [Alteromonas sp. C1M14]|uniref:transglycosylase SLT domain-containing protein n=1 Tax=Alteromonas sp. C1M14 TaxID=2841567 RepID=UPI001C0920BB|nr:transglycosylase SLT domain-containing protein [Alteromonas sp. C1M14]MBU2977511.1 transglycosylase SLT domain-containing protein [Alteromonas sp. C1M14]